jgi:hypothetical protein
MKSATLLMGCTTVVLAAAAPFARGAPGDGTFKAPAPVIEAPAPGTKFALEPGASLNLRVTLPNTPFGNAANLVAFAAASPEVEHWHIDVLRRGPGSSEDEASAFAGPLTALQFGEKIGKRLTAEWFGQHGGAGPYRIRAYLSQQGASGSSRGPAVSVDFDVVASAKSSSRFVQVPNSSGDVARDHDFNDKRGAHAQPRRITTARLTFVGLPPPGGGGSGGAPTLENSPQSASFVFTVPYTITSPAPQLASVRIRCAVSLGSKGGALAAGEVDVAVGGVALTGNADIAVSGSAGHNLAEARFYSCALKVSNGKMSLVPQFGGGIAWARAMRGSLFMVSGALD